MNTDLFFSFFHFSFSFVALQKHWIYFNHNGVADTYVNPDYETDQPVNDLLLRMTNEEKMQILHESCPPLFHPPLALWRLYEHKADPFPYKKPIITKCRIQL